MERSGLDARKVCGFVFMVYDALKELNLFTKRERVTMDDYLIAFRQASDDQKWAVCQNYVGQEWAVKKFGISESIKETHSKFHVTEMATENGPIKVATNLPLRSVIDHPILLVVQPPRNIEDLLDCNCALFVY